MADLEKQLSIEYKDGTLTITEDTIRFDESLASTARNLYTRGTRRLAVVVFSFLGGVVTLLLGLAALLVWGGPLLGAASLIAGLLLLWVAIGHSVYTSLVLRLRGHSRTSHINIDELTTVVVSWGRGSHSPAIGFSCETEDGSQYRFVEFLRESDSIEPTLSDVVAFFENRNVSVEFQDQPPTES